MSQLTAGILLIYKLRISGQSVCQTAFTVAFPAGHLQKINSFVYCVCVCVCYKCIKRNGEQSSAVRSVNIRAHWAAASDLL